MKVLKATLIMMIIATATLSSFANSKNTNTVDTVVQAKKLNFEFTVPQANLILRGLGELPLKESGDLSGYIIQEANKQMLDTTKKQEKLHFEFTVPQANMILRGLGELPLKESGDIAGYIIQEANKQIPPTVDTKPKAKQK